MKTNKNEVTFESILDLADYHQVSIQVFYISSLKTYYFESISHAKSECFYVECPSFEEGVDLIYDFILNLGVVPEEKKTSDHVDNMKSVYNVKSYFQELETKNFSGSVEYCEASRDFRLTCYREETCNKEEKCFVRKKTDLGKLTYMRDCIKLL